MPPRLVAFGGLRRSIMRPRPIVVFLVVPLGLLLGVEGCARRLQQVQVTPDARHSIAELWQEPVDLEQRDLFHGAGGAGRAPEDTDGRSPWSRRSGYRRSDPNRTFFR